MTKEMDIPLFFRVSTMTALSKDSILPMDTAVGMGMGMDMGMDLYSLASGFDPINVPDVIRLRSEQDCEEAFQLLISILRQPELGFYIRHIDLLRDTQFHGHYKPTQYQRYLSEEDSLLLRLAIRNAGWYGVEEEIIFNMLMQRNFDTDFYNGFSSSRARGGRHTRGSHMIQALTALLMSVAPNLESLKLRPIGRYMRDGYGTLPLEQFLLRCTTFFNSVFLQNLLRIDLLHTDDSLDNDPLYFNRYDLLYHMSLFHQLPSVKTIRVGGMDIHENGREDFPPLTSNLQNIELVHSVMPTMFLCSIIASSKRLRQFTHSVGGRAILDSSNWNMGFPAILRALLLHRESLESLDLDTDSDYSQDLEYEEFEEYLSDSPVEVDDEETEQDRIAFMNQQSVVQLIFLQTGCLRNFTALRRLSIGVHCLFQMAQGIASDPHSTLTLADTLPPNLEYLCIRGYEPGVDTIQDAHLKDMLQKFVAGQLGPLKEIRGLNGCIPNSATVHLDDVEKYPELVWIDERDAIV